MFSLGFKMLRCLKCSSAYYSENTELVAANHEVQSRFLKLHTSLREDELGMSSRICTYMLVCDS